MMKIFGKGLIVGALSIMMLPGNALAHTSPSENSVDNGEIRYENQTGYDNALYHGRDEWNQLNPIDILGDTSSTYSDLQYSDVDRSDVPWAGGWVMSAGVDDIYFNDHYMVPYSDYNEEIVGVHETGHALALDHSYDGEVMATSVGDAAYTPQDHDKEDYHSVWGY